MMTMMGDGCDDNPYLFIYDSKVSLEPIGDAEDA